uniref:Uncharacterized protein n=1 Tax=Oryza rufipogon TaxID=4529 RepID=A0A0E0QWL0_ORYRU
MAGLLRLPRQHSHRPVFHPFRRPSSPHLRRRVAVPKPQPLAACHTSTSRCGRTLPAAYNGTTSLEAPSSPHPPGPEPLCHVLPYPRYKPRLAEQPGRPVATNNQKVHLQSTPSPLRLQGSGVERRSQGPGLLRDLREDRGILRSRSLVKKGSKRPNEDLCAARLTYTAAWSSGNVTGYFNGQCRKLYTTIVCNDRQMMIERRQSSQRSRTLLPTCKNSPSEIVGYSSVKPCVAYLVYHFVQGHGPGSAHAS